MNAGIQGLAADIFKVALVRIDEALERGGLASRLVLQVHDEVLVEVPDRRARRSGRARHSADARRRRSRRPARGQRRVGRHLGRRQDLMMAEPPSHWFEPIAEHLGDAYLRYSFTKGTPQEVEYLVAELGLRSGQRVPRRRVRPGTPRVRARPARGAGARGRYQRAVRRARQARRAGGRHVRATRRPRDAVRRRSSTPRSASVRGPSG